MVENETGYATLEQCKTLIENARGDGCLFCKWFCEHEGANATEPPFGGMDKFIQIKGDCRKRSPVVWVHPECIDDVYAVWPEVTNRQWCGEFEQKYGVTPESICNHPDAYAES
jgi:hypothetical protein